MSTNPIAPPGATDLQPHLERASSLRDQGNIREAEEAVRAGWASLGVDRRGLHTKGPLALAGAVGPAGLRSVVELIAVEAELLRLAGDKDSARTAARWALSAMLHSAPPGDYADLTRRLVALADGRDSGALTPPLGTPPMGTPQLPK